LINVVDFSKTASSVISDAASVHSQQRSTKSSSFDNFFAAEQTGLEQFEILSNNDYKIMAVH